MSDFVATSPLRKRTYTRRFDYDEALRRYQAGESVRALAAEYGVTIEAVRRAVLFTRDPAERAASNAYSKAWRTTVCEACGGPAMRIVGGKLKHNPDGRVLCSRCRNIERTESLRFDDRGDVVAVRCAMLDCANGERWQMPEVFPRGRRFKDVREGGFHNQCRACLTRARRGYREARKVPCSHGCGTLVLHENARYPGKPPECQPCMLQRQREARAGQ